MTADVVWTKARARVGSKDRLIFHLDPSCVQAGSVKNYRPRQKRHAVLAGFRACSGCGS